MGFAYHSILELCLQRRSLLFCIAVAEHCIFALPSFFTRALVAVPVEFIHVSEGINALAESGVLLLLPAGAYAL